MLTAIDIAVAAGTPPRYIAQSGYWTAFMGSIPEGAPACGMSTTGGTTIVQMFMVKWFYGNAHLTIQILKENWRIPKNATGEIWITFDRGTPFYGDASAHQSGNTLELTIPILLIDNFLSEFREADKMYVSFRSGNEPPWTANMIGSRAVAIAFEQCVKNFLEQIKQREPTQPYASQPTQPYSLQPPPVAAATQPSPSQPSKEASTGWTGSGFFVTTAGHILTNAHVAQDCSSPMVRAVGNTPVAASVVALDSKIDLALMKTATRPIKVAPLRGTPPVSVGDEIIVFGFPLSGMLSSSGNATFGNISATLGMLDNPNHLQISAAVQSGNSGGPLLDSSGNVIGIVFAKLGMRAATLTGDLPQNINFAVKSSVAAKFLSDQGIAFETSEKTAELPKAEIVEMAKSFSVEITCDSASVSHPRPQERSAITIEKRSAEFLVNHYAAVSSGNNAALEYAMRTYAGLLRSKNVSKRCYRPDNSIL
jgi:S1-C subfamily serine protease